MYRPKLPTNKQIEYVDDIAEALNIDFPQTSKDFTRARYSAFISAHALKYRALRHNDPCYDDEVTWSPVLNG